MTTNIVLSGVETIVQLFYLLASICFIMGLRDMSNTNTARRGVILAELGMIAAVVGTLIYGVKVSGVIVDWRWISLGFGVGAVIGTMMGLWIPMTKMPERIALSHAFGGLAVAIVGVVEFIEHYSHGFSYVKAIATYSEVAIGSLTFTGSLIAFGKLQGIINGRPITFIGAKYFNFFLIAMLCAMTAYLSFFTANEYFTFIFFSVLAIGLVLGVTLVMPVGGADMPVVICLLNSYAGLAASATGFALENNVLIICGALDGCSGFILGMMMSKAMNRSFSNVLFGNVGSVKESSVQAKEAGESGMSPNVGTVEDAVEVLKGARSVIVVPGYGMAVAQAQHATRELASILTAGGCEVRYAIHPVAGRMPGHMNVLLAEANVSYDQLYDLEAINDDFSNTDVAIVIGANDVVNPAARNNSSSPIYGMPILEVDKAKVCIVIKRSLNPGFAGVENELFVKAGTMMVLGDAKKVVSQFNSALKDELR